MVGVNWGLLLLSFVNLHLLANVLYFMQALLYGSLNYFKLIGIVCGLAIYNSVIIDLPFPAALYKKLLKKLAIVHVHVHVHVHVQSMHYVCIYILEEYNHLRWVWMYMKNHI